MIIAVEGIDACGKATQTRLLTESLRREGYNAVRFDFPRYESPTGQAIQSLLTEEWTCTNRALVLQALMTINRYEFSPMLRSYKDGEDSQNILVLDRYFVSGIAYGIADGLSEDLLVNIHSCLPKPDFCLYLDIDPNESFSRRQERRDEYERREGFMAKVRQTYLDVFNKYSEEGWYIVSGMGTVEEVHTRILNTVDL